MTSDIARALEEARLCYEEGHGFGDDALLRRLAAIVREQQERIAEQDAVYNMLDQQVGDNVKEIDYLREKVRELTEPRPMATAPRDGTRILARWKVRPSMLGGKDPDLIAVVYWIDRHSGWVMPGIGLGEPDEWWELPPMPEVGK